MYSGKIISKSKPNVHVHWIDAASRTFSRWMKGNDICSSVAFQKLHLNAQTMFLPVTLWPWPNKRSYSTQELQKICCVFVFFENVPSRLFYGCDIQKTFIMEDDWTNRYVLLHLHVCVFSTKHQRGHPLKNSKNWFFFLVTNAAPALSLCYCSFLFVW